MIHIFLDASRIIGIVYVVCIPNPTVSASVNALVHTPSTIRLSANATLPGIPSSQVYPIRLVPASVGIVIQISVGLSPGLVLISNLHATHHDAQTTSHSSSSTVLPIPSAQDGCNTPSPHVQGVYVVHGGLVHTGPVHTSVFHALQYTSSL